MKDCPDSVRVVDVYGNHAISCMKDGVRTNLWHDAIRRTVCWLARRTGLKAEEEKDNILVLGPPECELMLSSNMVPRKAPSHHINR